MSSSPLSLYAASPRGKSVGPHPKQPITLPRVTFTTCDVYGASPESIQALCDAGLHVSASSDSSSPSSDQDDTDLGPVRTTKQSKAQRKAAANGPASAVPRSPNCFLLFRTEFLHGPEWKVVRDAVGDKQHKLSVVAGQIWAEMDEEKRLPYRQMSQERARLHKLANPDYRYTPAKRGSRKQLKKIKALEAARGQLIDRLRRLDVAGTAVEAAIDQVFAGFKGKHDSDSTSNSSRQSSTSSCDSLCSLPASDRDTPELTLPSTVESNLALSPTSSSPEGSLLDDAFPQIASDLSLPIFATQELAPASTSTSSLALPSGEQFVESASALDWDFAALFSVTNDSENVHLSAPSLVAPRDDQLLGHSVPDWDLPMAFSTTDVGADAFSFDVSSFASQQSTSSPYDYTTWLGCTTSEMTHDSTTLTDLAQSWPFPALEATETQPALDTTNQLQLNQDFELMLAQTATLPLAKQLDESNWELL